MIIIEGSGNTNNTVKEIILLLIAQVSTHTRSALTGYWYQYNIIIFHPTSYQRFASIKQSIT